MAGAGIVENQGDTEDPYYPIDMVLTVQAP